MEKRQEDLQEEYEAIERHPFFSLPFLVSFLICCVIAVSVTTYSVQKTSADAILDDLGYSFMEQLHDRHKTTIINLFTSAEDLLAAPDLVIQSRYAHPIDVMAFRPTLMKLASSRLVQSTEAHVVLPDGRLRENKFSKTLDDSVFMETEQTTPGGTRTTYLANKVSLNRTQIDVNETDEYEKEWDIEHSHPIGYLTPFIRVRPNAEPEMVTGVYQTYFTVNNTLSFFIMIQFRMVIMHNLLQMIVSKYPFVIAIVEKHSGKLIVGDDIPFSSHNGSFPRRTYSNSRNPLIRDGGRFVFSQNHNGSSSVAFARGRAALDGGDVDCYIGYSTIQMRNLSWVIYIVIPVSGVRGDVDRINTRITISMAVAFVVILGVSVGAVVWISSVLNGLCESMGRVTRLDLESVDTSSSSRIRITELKRIQISFFIMVEVLKEYCKYLPKALLLANSDEEIDDDDDGNVWQYGPNPLALTSIEAKSDVSFENVPEPSSPPSSPRVGEKKTNSFRKNSLRLKKICVMRVVFPSSQTLAQNDPVRSSAFSIALLQIVSEAVGRHDGVCMHLTPASIVICWNGHKVCVGPEKKAILCAKEIAMAWGSIAAFADQPWMICIGAGQGVVGTEGYGRHKTPVILGAVPKAVQLISYLALRYPHTILITDKVRDATSTCASSRIVDVLMVEDTKTFLYECFLERPDSSGSVSANDMTIYNEGFSALQGHDYVASAQKFLEYVRTSRVADVHALRLYQISMYLLQNNLPWKERSFVGWTALEDAAKEIEVPDDIEDILADSIASIASTSTTISLTIDPTIHLRDAINSFRTLKSPTPAKSRYSSSSSDDSDKTTNAPFPSQFLDHFSQHWRCSQKILGAGAFGGVYLGMGIDGGLVAMKAVKIDSTASNKKPKLPKCEEDADFQDFQNSTQTSRPDQALEEILMEVSLLSNLRDENIVGYVGSCVVEGTLLIIMEYVPGGSLASLLTEFGLIDVAAAQRYVRDIVRGLNFLHRSDVIHQDVKLGNVLLMIDGQCKLTDFGASAKLGQLRAQNKVQGTPLYMAPEQCTGNVCKASDIWAVGILTCQLLTGKMPYPDELLDGLTPFRFMYTLGRDATVVPVVPSTMPPTARSFCEAILKRDPTQRPTAESLLHHPFLVS